MFDIFRFTNLDAQHSYDGFNFYTRTRLDEDGVI